MPARRAVLLVACLALCGCSTSRRPPAGPREEPESWIEIDLARAAPVSFGGEGDVRATTTSLVLRAGSPLTGVVFEPVPPPPRYELEATAARLSGVDFFCGLTFPTSRGNLTLVLGGWGGAVCGLSSLDGRDASANETRRLRSFARDCDVAIRIVVDGDRVTIALDGEPFLAADLAGRTVAVRAEVEPTEPFGFCCYSTDARLSSLRFRPLPASP